MADGGGSPIDFSPSKWCEWKRNVEQRCRAAGQWNRFKQAREAFKDTEGYNGERASIRAAWVHGWEQVEDLVVWFEEGEGSVPPAKEIGWHGIEFKKETRSGRDERPPRKLKEIKLRDGEVPPIEEDELVPVTVDLVEKVATRQEMDWVAAYLEEKVDVSEAPSKVARNMLRWARQDVKGFWGRYLGGKADEQARGAMEDDGRENLSLLDGIVERETDDEQSDSGKGKCTAPPTGSDSDAKAADAV